MSQPNPSIGQPAGPLQPSAPAPVRTAVKLMYAGAAVSAVTLIISLALVPAVKAALGKATPSLTAAQVSDVNILIVLAMVFGLAVVAVWLWMARANGQGRNWARILSTVLFGAGDAGADHGQATASGRLSRSFCRRGPRVLGDPFGVRRDSARPDRPRAALADRRYRGVAALAPGLQRVLQAAGRRLRVTVLAVPSIRKVMAMSHGRT